MSSPACRVGALGTFIALLFSAPLRAEPAPLLDAPAMSARIDQFIAAKWAEKGVKPTGRTTDAEFFRRLSLDINGRIPKISKLTDFVDDDRPDKRRLWLEELISGKDHGDHFANHWTTYWRTLIFSQTTNQQAQFIGAQLDGWLRNQVRNNTPYNDMVKELLTSQQGFVFYQANENKPENVAGNSARLFLGVKLECAQCHDDRSGGHWTREQFWQYAAFFTDVAGRGGNAKAEIKIPEKNTVVKARFLDGVDPAFKADVSPRVTLADWMTTAENPYFAKAAVNRMWYYFFGTGLTDPVDTMGTEENPPSHPEVLDELAYQFAAHRFDVRYLIRVIVGTQAYQLSSVQTDESQADLRLFARMPVRGLTPEQLIDSVIEATAYENRSAPNNMRFNAFGQGNPRADFIAKFSNNKDKRTETQTSILQALYLMNSPFMQEQIKNSRALRAVQENEKSPIQRNISELYIVTVSRKPTAAEMDKMVKYVEGKSRNEALADIFWALLNSAEFLLNH